MHLQTMANSRRVALLGCLFDLVSLVTTLGPPSRPGFDNPVRLRAPDPSIVFAGGSYSMVYTSDTYIAMTQARTLDGLLAGETRVFWSDTTPERARHLWAPELHRIDGRWYVLYSACDARVPCCETCKTRVLGGCAARRPYDCPYAYLATLVPAPGRQGGRFRNESFSIDGTFLEIPGRGRYHVVSARDAGGVQAIQITELDTRAWTVKEWHVISRPDQSVCASIHMHIDSGTMLLFVNLPFGTVGVKRYQLGTLTRCGGCQ